MSFTINIQGIEALQKRLNQDLKEKVSAALTAGALTIKGKAAIYPPPVGYPRTGRLGRSWTIMSSLGGLTVEIGNNTPYGPYVQDEGQQTWFHAAHGWSRFQQVARDNEAEVVAKVKKALDGL